MLIVALSSIYNGKRGMSQAPFPCLIKDQVLLEYGGGGGGNCTPLSFLQLFWSDDLFDFIRVQTNKNAEVKRNANPEKHKTQWREINEK